MAEQFELPYLGEIPIVQSIREGGDRGVPAVIDDEAVSKKAFAELARNVARNVAIRNADLEPTKVVEMKD